MAYILLADDHAILRDGIRALIGSDAYKGGEIDWGAGHVHPLNFTIGMAQAASRAAQAVNDVSARFIGSHLPVRAER